MRWSIIRLIWIRELRDQLRDRRTIIMIAVLPVLLYPLAGVGTLQIAGSYLAQKTLVGIAGLENLHPWNRTPATPSPGAVASLLCMSPAPPGVPLGGVASLVTACGFWSLQEAGREVDGSIDWFAVTPPPVGCPLGMVTRLAGGAGFGVARRSLDYPGLIEEHEEEIRFARGYAESGPAGENLYVRSLPLLPAAAVAAAGKENPYSKFLADRKVDLILVIPEGFQETLQRGGRPEMSVYTRDKDETGKLATARVSAVVNRWRRDLRETRLARLGVPSDFDQTIQITEPERDRSGAAGGEEESLFAVLVKVFPFILVMWSLAGALYPAVDLCAGEKERGTMETLLISPASREEIVWGKFLTIWVFSAATALLNLVSIGLTTWRLAVAQPQAGFRAEALLWGVLLLLPLSAFFSALCLSVGAYARSSKEGQYYLMPLFLLTMPLIFLTLVPGVELNPFYCMVPVTGVALLLQKLVASSVDLSVSVYFVPVLAPMVIYSWLSLRWAIGQFNREEVLFREAERLDIGLWLKSLWRDKEALPSVGEAFFCFFLILGLRWVSFGIGGHLSLLTRTGISQLAFVVTPPLFMALLLTTRPAQSLNLRWAALWSWPAAVVLAILVLPPLAELTLAILVQFPALKALLEQNHPLTQELRALPGDAGLRGVAWYFLVLAVLPAVCEELAFRGFILRGLMRSFRPWTAIVMSAFLFSLYQMNVFQFLPHFLFGVVLGLFVHRSGSVLPGILFHFVYNSCLIAPVFMPAAFSRFTRGAEAMEPQGDGLRLIVAVGCAAVAGAALYFLWKGGSRKEPT